MGRDLRIRGVIWWRIIQIDKGNLEFTFDGLRFTIIASEGGELGAFPKKVRLITEVASGYFAITTKLIDILMLRERRRRRRRRKATARAC